METHRHPPFPSLSLSQDGWQQWRLARPHLPHHGDELPPSHVQVDLSEHWADVAVPEEGAVLDGDGVLPAALWQTRGGRSFDDVTGVNVVLGEKLFQPGLL